MQRTLILLKPDCLERKVAGEVITRFEKKGYDILASKMIQLDEELLNEHYSHVAHLPFFPEIASFMSSRPVLARTARRRRYPEFVTYQPTDSTTGHSNHSGICTDRMRNGMLPTVLNLPYRDQSFLRCRPDLRLGLPLTHKGIPQMRQLPRFCRPDQVSRW